MEKIERHLYRRQYQTAGGDWVTKFYAVFTCHDGKRRTFPAGDDLQSAKDKLGVLRKRDSGEFDFDAEKRKREVRVRLSEWGRVYFEKMIDPNKRSLEWQRSMFAKVESRLGDYYLDEIDETVIDDYREKRLREPIIRHGKPLKDTQVSYSTVNRELAVLRKL